MLLILWFELTHDVQKSPLSLIKILLSFGVFAFRYAPGKSKLGTLSHSCESTMSVQNRSSNDTVGDDMLYPSFKYLFYYHMHIYFP